MSDKNYNRILKSSSIIGGAQGIKMLIAMVHVKCAALFVGPAGIGLLGIYQSIQRLASLLMGFGLANSAVRDIAEAHSAGDLQKVSTVIITVRRMYWLTGIVGALLITAVAPYISALLLLDSNSSITMTLIGISVLFMNLATGHSALIQGTRHIADLARMRIIASVLGTFCSVALYYWLGINGVVLAILAGSILEWVLAQYYASRIELQQVSVTWFDTFRTANGLFRLGISFMWMGLVGASVALLVKSFIENELGIVAVGIFAAAYGLSSKFVTFILNAMSADYFPSLSALSHDHLKMTELVNHQTEIGLLLAMPGLVATMIFAPFLVSIFYSSEFSLATDLLRWLILSCFGRILTWPLGYVLLAKRKGITFSGLQTSVEGMRLIFVIIGIKYMGLIGAAIGTFLLQPLFLPVCLVLSWHIIRFSYSAQAVRLILVSLALTAISFLLCTYLSSLLSIVMGSLLLIAVSWYCLRELSRRLNNSHKLNKLINSLPLVKTLLHV